MENISAHEESLEEFYWYFNLAVIFVGLCGNSFILSSVAIKKEMQTPVNIVLATIAAAETFLCAISFIVQHFQSQIFLFIPILVTVFFIIRHKLLKKTFLKRDPLHRMLLWLVIIFVMISSQNLVVRHILVPLNILSPYALDLEFSHKIVLLSLVYKPFLYIACDRSFNNGFRTLVSRFF